MRGSRREVHIARRDPLPWLITGAATAIAGGALAVAVVASHRRVGLRGLERRQVIVHVPNGPSLQGLLVEVLPDSLQLSRAKHLDSSTDLGGDVYVPRSPGVFIQTVVQESLR